MDGVILAIDQGTSGTKAIVVDPEDGIIGIASEPVRPSYLGHGGVEQDPAELLQSVLVAGHRAIAAAGRPVAVVSLANQGETVLAWDRASGRPLSNAIVWQDRRAESVVATLTGAKAWVAERTGLVLDAYFSAPKMTWIRRNVTTDGVVTTTDSWLVHQLCGVFVTDASTVSRSLLTSLDAVNWDSDLLRLFDWDNEALPRIVSCDEQVGTTREFGGEAAVAGLIVDQQAALLAEGCLSPGMAKCTFGTGAFLLANTGPTGVRSQSGLTSSVAWRARDHVAYCVDGQVYTAASAARWLTNLGLISGPEDLDARSAADDGGVLCVPALAGLAAPWWRADATATLTGMTLSTEPGHLVRAVLQGIAAQVAELVKLVNDESGQPLERLRVDGGLTNSRVLMQATADQLQLPIDVYPSPHATAEGAAALGLLALSPRLALADVVPAWEPKDSYEPHWSPDRAADYHDRWSGVVGATLPTGAQRDL